MEAGGEAGVADAVAGVVGLVLAAVEGALLGGEAVSKEVVNVDLIESVD